jgi:hypothetical protein
MRRDCEEQYDTRWAPLYGEKWFDNEEVYHYHPTNQQVKEWVQQTGFETLKEGKGEIYYFHVLARKVGGSSEFTNSA